MHIDTPIRTPYHQLPITIVNKAIRQKVYRPVFCIECKWPLCEITDKVIIVSDSAVTMEYLRPNEIGIVDIHCSNHRCKQYYRMEFAA